MSLNTFDRATLHASAWKNGGGVTREIACWPQGAGMNDFLWRLSIATVAVSGPFSAFPGIDRVITLLDGPGVRLTSDDGAIDHRLDRPLAPFAFPGEASIHGAVLGEASGDSLSGDASSDFNVMTRRAAVRAQVDVLHDPSTVALAPHGMLLSVDGYWQVHDAIDGTERLLAPGQGLWWADETHGGQVLPDATDTSLIVVRIVPRSES